MDFFIILTYLFACNDSDSKQDNNALNSGPPVVNITSHSDGDSVAEYQRTTFTGSVSDPQFENADLITLWRSDNEIICPETSPTTEGTTSCSVEIDKNKSIITLEVFNPNNIVGLDDVQLNIVESGSPQIEFLEPSSSEILCSDSKVLIRAQVLDAEDSSADLQISWNSSLDGAISMENDISDEGILTSRSYLNPGNHTLTLIVEDSDGKIGQENIVLTIRDSQTDETCLTISSEPPIIDLLSPTEDGLYISDTPILFEARISDPEDGPENLFAVWQSNIDGFINVDVTPNVQGLISGQALLSEGQHYITLDVEDSKGKESSTGIVITVGPPNSPPSCEIISPNDGFITSSGTSISFEGEVSDINIDNSSLQVEWSSDMDGILGTSMPNNSGDVMFPTSGLSINNHQITMLVTDDWGATCTDSIQLTIQ